MKSASSLFLAGIVALACLPGCSAGQAQVASKKVAPPKAGSANPEEQLDEARMAEATRGLQFGNGLVTTSTTQADAKTGESLRIQAETVTEQRNVWFISVAAFRDAILADPTNAKSYEGLARAMLLEGKTDYAESALATALNLDPRFTKAMYELGMVKQMDSDYAGAVTEWNALTKIDPEYQDVFARMSIASYYQQDYKSAWNFLNQADKRHQNVPPQFRPLLKETAPQP